MSLTWLDVEEIIEKSEKVYLANFDYSVSYYLGETKDFKNQIRLVYANNPKEAEGKLRVHFGFKTSEYDVYYRVNNVEITEPII
jgi:hypothetical protein